MPSSTITLKSLKIEGFLSYKNPVEVEFREGVTVIVGENGSGKTSLVEAIYFALTGEYPRGSKDETINYGSRRMRVELTLDTPSGEIKIIREREKGFSKNIDIVELNGKKVAYGTEETKTYIASIMLGRRTGDKNLINDFKNLLETTIIRQGQIIVLTNLLESNRWSEKKKFIDRILGLDSYEKAYDGMRDLTREVKFTHIDMTRSFSVKREDIKELRRTMMLLKDNLKKKETELKETEEKQASIEEELRKTEAELEKLKARIKRLEEKLLELEDKSEKYMSKKGSLEQLKSQEIRIKQEIQKLEQEKEEVRGRLERIKPVASLTEKLTRILREEEELNELRILLSEAERFCNKVLDCLNTLKKLKINEKYLIENKEELLNNLRRAEHIIKSIKYNNDKLTRLKKTLETKLSSVLEKIRQENLLPREEIAAKSLENIIAALKRRVEELKADIENKKYSISEVRTKIENLEDSISKLEKAESRCPVCGASLTIERKSALITNYRETLEQLKHERERLMKELNEKNRVMSAIEELIENNLRSLEKTLYVIKDLESEIAEDTERLKKILPFTIEEATIREAENTLLELDKYFELLNRAIINLRNKTSTFRYGLEQYFKLEENVKKTDLRKMLLNIQSALHDVENKLKELCTEKDKLAREARTDVFRKALYLARNPQRAEEFVNEVKQLENEFVAKEKQLGKLYEEKERIISLKQQVEFEIEQLGYDPEEHKKLKEEFDELKKEEVDLVQKKTSLTEKLAFYKQEIEKIRNDIDKIKEDIKRLKEVHEELTILNYIREELYHRDKLPRDLRTHAIRLLELELNNIIQLFELTYNEARVNDDIDITLVGPSGQTPLSMASGGEKIVFTISFILALQRVLQIMKGEGRSIGFLILDEPTIFLDETRKNKLIDVITRFRGGTVLPQLIIVTHDEDLKEASDQIYLVRKTSTGSIVKEETVEAVPIAT